MCPVERIEGDQRHGPETTTTQTRTHISSMARISSSLFFFRTSVVPSSPSPSPLRVITLLYNPVDVDRITSASFAWVRPLVEKREVVLTRPSGRICPVSFPSMYKPLVIFIHVSLLVHVYGGEEVEFGVQSACCRLLSSGHGPRPKKPAFLCWREVGMCRRTRCHPRLVQKNSPRLRVFFPPLPSQPTPPTPPYRRLKTYTHMPRARCTAAHSPPPLVRFTFVYFFLQAWNDLYHMGYRSDLTFGLGYGDEIYTMPPPPPLAAAAAGASDPAQRRALLPELTTKALTWWVVYGVGRGGGWKELEQPAS